MFLVFVVFIGAIAVNSGNNLVYLTFSTILSFVLLSGFLSFSNLKKISVEIEFEDFVFAKKHSLCFLILKNNSGSPKFGLNIKVLDKVFYVDILSDIRSVSFVQMFEKRGIAEASKVYLSSIFPFGFFERKKEVEIEGKITVFPEVKNVTLKRIPGDRGELQNKNKGNGDEFYSVREYAEGEDSRKINWKLSAKANNVMVVETKSLNENTITIFFDTSSYLYKSEEEFENVLIKINSFVYQCFIKQIPISFVSNLANFSSSNSNDHYRKIFETLATAKITETTPMRKPAGAVSHEDILYV